jgi:hypothetical protein
MTWSRSRPRSRVGYLPGSSRAGPTAYYFDYEPIIAWDVTLISGKRLGTKSDGLWQDAWAHPITVEGRADGFPRGQ